MSKILYLECSSGISGDMTVASLLDLGANKEKLLSTLKSLPINGFDIKITRVNKSGIDACDFDVILDNEHDNHDHDMEYLHGHHSHDEHDPDAHGDHQGHHEHRCLADILNIIQASNLTPHAKDLAIKIFDIIADAEAKAHNLPKDKVHFHEVGAIDSIVDIAAVSFCLDDLGITDIIVTELSEGKGVINCQHGILPIPVPAVTNIVASHNLNLHIADVEGELVTPTGAGIVAAIKTSDVLPDKFNIEKIGIGAGKRNYNRPSLLRAMIISDNTRGQDVIYKLESGIDDSTGESLGYVMDCLFDNGAKDVSYTPIFMKKNRPAYLLTVIAKKEDISKLENIIFEETTTIGIRKIKMERSVLDREIKIFNSSLGEVKVKVCKLSSGEKYYPEYSDVIKICNLKNITFSEAYKIIQYESEKKFKI